MNSIILTGEQLRAWAGLGRDLTTDEVDRLCLAIPDSTVPAAIEGIVAEQIRTWGPAEPGEPGDSRPVGSREILHVKAWTIDGYQDVDFWEARPASRPLEACYIYPSEDGFEAEMQHPDSAYGGRRIVAKDAPRPRDTWTVVAGLLAEIYGPRCVINHHPSEPTSLRVSARRR